MNKQSPPAFNETLGGYAQFLSTFAADEEEILVIIWRDRGKLQQPRNMESISLLLKGWHKYCTILVKNLSKFAYVKKKLYFCSAKIHLIYVKRTI